MLIGSYRPVGLRLKIELSILLFLEECSAAKPLFSIKRVKLPKNILFNKQKNDTKPTESTTGPLSFLVWVPAVSYPKGINGVPISKTKE